MNLFARLKTSFVAGLILVAPLAVTVFILQFVFERVTATIRPLIREIVPVLSRAFGGDIVLVAQVLSAVIVALCIATLGYVASMSLGQRAFGSFERGVRLVPFARTVYFGVRQVSESLLERSAGYENVVLVEFPREGLWAVGFLTNEAPRSARRATGEELYSVFVPHSPNPTAGTLVLATEGEVVELDMSVGRGLRLLVTTGLSVDEVDVLPAGVVR